MSHMCEDSNNDGQDGPDDDTDEEILGCFPGTFCLCCDVQGWGHIWLLEDGSSGYGKYSSAEGQELKQG